MADKIDEQNYSVFVPCPNCHPTSSLLKDARIKKILFYTGKNVEKYTAYMILLCNKLELKFSPGIRTNEQYSVKERRLCRELLKATTLPIFHRLINTNQHLSIENLWYLIINYSTPISLSYLWKVWVGERFLTDCPCMFVHLKFFYNFYPEIHNDYKNIWTGLILSRLPMSFHKLVNAILSKKPPLNVVILQAEKACQLIHEIHYKENFLCENTFYTYQNICNPQAFISWSSLPNTLGLQNPFLIRLPFENEFQGKNPVLRLSLKVDFKTDPEKYDALALYEHINSLEMHIENYNEENNAVDEKNFICYPKSNQEQIMQSPIPTEQLNTPNSTDLLKTEVTTKLTNQTQQSKQPKQTKQSKSAKLSKKSSKNTRKNTSKKTNTRK